MGVFVSITTNGCIVGATVMAEKVTGDINRVGMWVAAKRKAWATPRVLVSQETRAAGKNTASTQDTHVTAPHEYGRELVGHHLSSVVAK